MTKMRKLLVGILLVNAAVAFGSPEGKDTIPAEIKFSNFEKNLDSLMNIWYVQDGNDDASLVEDADTTVLFPEIPDSFYINRLRKIPSFIELTYNDIVKSYIQVYTVKKRDKLAEILALKDYYFPIFEQILDQNQMPIELKYLAVIESALNPRAVSRVGATGMWQFMYGTGKMYNLNVNTFVDERRDPIAATHAAAKFLKDLYRIYGDWVLVIAAYNCGPGNVNKAIRRSGGKKNYWDIYYYLPKETRGYVPAFIAATYAINYYKDHNISPNRNVEVPSVSDTIMINQNVHLQQIAGVLNIPIQQLRVYNPEYKADIIPGQWSSCPLMLPASYTTRFIEFEDSIYNYKDASFNIAELRLGNPVNYKGKYATFTPAGNQHKNIYTVRSGDNLGSISAKFHVSISDLREWNGIHKNVIRSGQRLVVYSNKKSVVSSENDRPQLSASTASASSNKLQDEEFVYYKVKSGDTLWEIANQYPGVSDADLLKWNNLSSSSKIIPGQKLKIKKSN
jgi:membrane-bound lytic murein transglycosylase D